MIATSLDPVQYWVLLEGLGAFAVAAGLSVEALRHNALRILGYANVGVALICLSVVAGLSARISDAASAETWLAFGGFTFYLAAAVGSWATAALRHYHRHHHDHDHGRGGAVA